MRLFEVQERAAMVVKNGANPDLRGDLLRCRDMPR